ncbi:MAG: hypothetical protein EAZ57_08820 [Cytophagales bacterium]|nr:MAG: hypothetical protein EAZ67_09630 [Cytophagales bacterium]TAF60128.1 MAG: hypothetical protein EAZ57_08820 [Cytophagales bacterium]
MKPNSRHAKLKPSLKTNFAAPNIALIGSDKALIQRFVEEVSLKLHVGILKPNDSFFRPQSVAKDLISVGESEYFSEIRINAKLSERQLYHLLAEYELVFQFEQNQFAEFAIVFGHIPANVNPETILAVCNDKNDSEDFLLFERDELDALAEFVVDWTQQKASQVPLYGLVLAGGHGSRMDKDKGSLEYYEGITQRQRGYQLLQRFCGEVFISCRKDQIKKMEYPYVEDKFLDLGPLSGILSAFQHEPNAAWLVIACDMPLLTEKAVLHLIENRNALKIATCYQNERRNHPEPLLAIWEPKSYRILLDFLAKGETCPKKILQMSDYKSVVPIDEIELQNVNTPEEYEQVLKRLNKNVSI